MACPIRSPAPPFHVRNLLVLLLRIALVLACCLFRGSAKLFEAKSKKVARLTAELAALEAERLSKLVVVFGYEFDKLGFYTSVSISTVLFVALIIQLSRSRRKWKNLALSGAASGQPAAAAGGAGATAPRRYTAMLALGVAVFFYYLTFNLGKAIESKRNKAGRSSSGKGGIDPQRLSNLVIVFGKYQLDETNFYVLVVTAMVLLVALGAQIGIWCRQWRGSQSEKERVKYTIGGVAVPPRDEVLGVVIVGCGPQSVGWFHLMQFLDMPKINVRAVVEPYYLDKTKCSYPPQSFVDLVMMLDDMGITCTYHVGQLDIFKRQTLCVIAGRTIDNPRLFRECVGMGTSHIYLESPGAPTIAQLRDMQSLAVTRGVEVYMGYQRLSSSYIEKAVSLSRSVSRSHVFLCHNETHPPGELHLVIDRQPDGLLRSMAAQELAVLVKQFGVKAEEVDTFKVNTNPLFSERQEFYNKSNGKRLADFSRVAFKMTTKNRKSVSVMADRCGGLVSFAVVKTHTGKELQRFPSHDEGQASKVQEELKEDTEIMHQYVIESDEYLELKRRVVKRILDGDTGKSAVLVSIQDGIDIMALADYCTLEIDAVLKEDEQ